MRFSSGTHETQGHDISEIQTRPDIEATDKLAKTTLPNINWSSIREALKNTHDAVWIRLKEFKDALHLPGKKDNATATTKTNDISPQEDDDTEPMFLPERGNILELNDISTGILNPRDSSIKDGELNVIHDPNETLILDTPEQKNYKPSSQDLSSVSSLLKQLKSDMKLKLVGETEFRIAQRERGAAKLDVKTGTSESSYTAIDVLLKKMEAAESDPKVNKNEKENLLNMMNNLRGSDWGKAVLQNNYTLNKRAIALESKLKTSDEPGAKQMLTDLKRDVTVLSDPEKKLHLEGNTLTSRDRSKITLLDVNVGKSEEAQLAVFTIITGLEGAINKVGLTKEAIDILRTLEGSEWALSAISKDDNLSAIYRNIKIDNQVNPILLQDLKNKIESLQSPVKLSVMQSLYDDLKSYVDEYDPKLHGRDYTAAISSSKNKLIDLLPKGDAKTDPERQLFDQLGRVDIPLDEKRVKPVLASFVEFGRQGGQTYLENLFNIVHEEPIPKGDEKDNKRFLLVGDRKMFLPSFKEAFRVASKATAFNQVPVPVRTVFEDAEVLGKSLIDDMQKNNSPLHNQAVKALDLLKKAMDETGNKARDYQKFYAAVKQLSDLADRYVAKSEINAKLDEKAASLPKGIDIEVVRKHMSSELKQKENITEEDIEVAFENAFYKAGDKLF